MANCLNWKSEEVEKLAKLVGEVNSPAFADKIGTLMDSLGMEDISILPTPEQVKEYLKSTKETLIGLQAMRDGKKSLTGLKHAEVTLPAWTKAFFKDFLDENNNVDYNKINTQLPELLDMISYRIPTEDKYSMLPLKVVGFLPFQSGGAIMMPAEITTISGADYDVDKMYLIIKNLSKKNGKYQVEKYLDETNSTIEERKLAYAKRTDEGRKIIAEYEDKLTEINDKLDKFKPLTRKEIADELNTLADKIRDIEESLKSGIDVQVMINGKMMSSVEQLEYLKGNEAELTNQAKLLSEKSIINNDINSRAIKLISDEDFNKISIPDQNTKGARDNRKLDLMTSVLQHETTTGDIMNPGGFVKLGEVATEIDGLKGNKNKFKTLFDLISLDAITIQNITGKPLVGIAANHNAHAALRQHYNLTLKTPVIFDDIKLDNLSAKEGEDGNITRNLAEILAAIVDNAKDPLAEKLNYNEHTADFVSLLIGVGVPLKTAFAFINHPTILAAMKKINQGDATSLQDGLKAVMKDLNIKYDKKVGIKSIKSNALLKAIGTKPTGNELDRNVLFNAMEYITMSKALGDLIRASKADTAGITQSIEGGQATLDLIKKILADSTFAISGVEEFFNGISSKENPNPEETSFVGSFTENGIKKPIENIFNNMFPYGNKLFNQVKMELNSLAMYDLSKVEREGVNKDFISFMTTDLDYYNPVKADKEFDRIELIKTVPAALKYIKTIYKDLVDQDKDIYNRFLAVLNTTKDEKMGIDIISFNNTATSTEEQLNEIRNAWASMFNPYAEPGTMEFELNILANQLLRYSFWTSGHNFTPNSLGKLIPIDYYMGIKDSAGNGIVSKTKALLTAKEIDKTTLNIFTDQYIRNNAYNVKLVPRIDEEFANIGGSGNFKDDKITIYGPEVKDSNLISYSADTKEFSGVPYIAYSDKGTLKLYKNVKSNDGNSVVYERVGLLGSRTLKEYDRNNPDLTSAVNKNNYPVGDGGGAGLKKGVSEGQTNNPEKDAGLVTKELSKLFDNKCSK